MPERTTTDSTVELVSSDVTPTDSQQSIIVVGRNRLLNLERSVERRYLKPPLGRRLVGELFDKHCHQAAYYRDDVRGDGDGKES